MADRARLLLVEFVSSDRFSQYRSELYPFLRGYAEERGTPVTWLAYGFDPRALPTSRYLMALDAADTAHLVATLRDVRPTHVLFNEQLDAPLAAAVREAAGEARRAVCGIDKEACNFHQVGFFEAWLAGTREEHTDASRGALLVDVANPTWQCTLANAKVSEIGPFVQILAGPECIYHAPIGRLPEFAGIDLDAANRQHGCTFCGFGGSTRYPYRLRPIEQALRQLRAARATCPPARNRGEYAVAGAAVFLRLREFFDAVLAEGLPPSQFYFGCRIDELRRKADLVEALLPRLRAAGHTLDIGNMGVENFSEAENRRFNKGVTTADIEVAHERLARWEREWPETFRFTKNGGFGFILFSPWTTADDLRANLVWAERLGLHASSFFFVSRVQLLPGRPLTMLAERDGLVASDFDEATLRAFDSGCIVSAVEDERPWRFRVPAMAAVYGVFTLWRQLAMLPGEGGSGAPLALRRLLLGLPPEERTARRFLGEVLDAAEAHPEVRTADELLAAVRARLAPRLRPVVDASPETVATEASGDAEDAGTREARDTLLTRAREVLRALESHPKRLLRGFEARGATARATGRGWGELRLELARGTERLRVVVAPHDAARHAFVATERFAVTYDSEQPADTREKQELLGLLARALERYVAARERGPAPPSADAARRGEG